MTAAIQAFTYDGKPFRVALLAADDLWFFAKDICAALDLSNVSKALDRLDADEKGITTEDTLGGPQEVLIVSAPGAYRLIFQSRKPGAEKFKRWLAHDVIPAIFKTGRYEAPASGKPPGTVDPRNANRIRYAKMSLVAIAMRLEEFGVDASRIDMGAVVRFGRQLASL